MSKTRTSGKLRAQHPLLTSDAYELELHRTLFLAKLYTNSFLSALNDRLFRSEQPVRYGDIELSTSEDPSISSRVLQRRSKRTGTGATEVRILTEHERSVASTGRASLETQDVPTGQSNGADWKPIVRLRHNHSACRLTDHA